MQIEALRDIVSVRAMKIETASFDFAAAGAKSKIFHLCSGSVLHYNKNCDEEKNYFYGSGFVGVWKGAAAGGKERVL